MPQNNVNIVIRYDYKLGDELPYVKALEALERGEDFTTNCLEFFNADNLGAVVIRKDGKCIFVEDLLNNVSGHTRKHIRKEHNLHKILISGGFDW